MVIISITMAKQKRILIAEDEKPMARALTLKLEHEGYEVETTYDGEEAISKLAESQFDLILCDLVMPKVDGFAVLEEVKNKKIKTPIVILSNLGQEEDQEKAKSLGAKEFFIKSNTPIKNIVEQVKKMLG